jgi:hypothetical protein
MHVIQLFSYGMLSVFHFFPFIAEIGGPTGQLLEHNAQILNRIYTNISSMQVLSVFYVTFSASSFLIKDCIYHSALCLF